ncbi:non-ribosomal peptide synthetase [Amycolatopsis sp. RTGN1]|uniref:non-ribosomal peptide synthetase n=1 Tax=Amycolatopsis ponsaeliensis TaxID=2992142 RepID=UPI00254DE098|nr:non-ribosomal peptide synthetase [Amycolatopsis sp. RTGN1]
MTDDHDGLTAVHLPIGGSRPGTPEMLRRTLSWELIDALRGFGGDPFPILVAAYLVLLARYADRPDITVGAVDDLHQVQSTVDNGGSFGAFLETVRETTPPGTRTVVARVGGPGGRAELAVTFTDDGGELGFAIRYPRELFGGETVERLAGRFEVLLAGALADPGRTAAALPVLTEPERRWLLVDRNDTAAPYPGDRSVAELFAEQVRAVPGEPAVVAGGTTLGYAELDARANGLAHRLVAAGVRAESRVGVLLGRSPHAVVTMLAVLKAGGAYVPLHDSYPDDRIRWVLEDTGAVVVVTDQEMEEKARAAGTPVVIMDETSAAGARPDGLAVTVHPGQLAYVMYTSGSTGTPKGVAVTHRNVASLAWDHRFRTGAHRSVLFHSPHAFDAATYELWTPLLAGGRVVVAPAELTPRLLANLVAEHRMTAMWLTAGLFAHFADESPECFAGLREVWTGGEAPSPAAVERVRAACPDTTIVNGYGPTETTTFATAHHLDRDRVPSSGLPIGRPLDNMRAYVLDAFLEPVPAGTRGELYLAGDGVARGYFARPGLTAERFVADPFTPGGRLYRTGDRVRWNGDGELEFLGRADAQLKIRGFRIEPGEIETALRSHAGVSDAVVVARAAGATRSLVAYVATGQQAGVDEPGLRSHLSGRLPGFLVPSRFVVLESLPVNANGKVDRAALPDPGPVDAAGFTEPRTETERLLAELWSEVLGARRVGVTENFVSLGGDSILAMKVVSLARSRGIRLTAADVFARPTVADLAAIAGVQSPPVDVPRGVHASPAGLPPAVRDLAGAGGEIEDAYPLTAMQSGMLFDALLARDPGLHLIRFTLTVDGVDDPGALERAWQLAVAANPVLRTAVIWEGVDTPLQIVHRRVTMPVTRLDWRSRSDGERGRELRRLLDDDRAAGVEFTRAPLTRLTIARVTDTSVTMVWSIHHILLDGWSSTEVIEDVLAHYAALRNERSPEPVARQAFRDYATWLDRQDHTEAEGFWREQLGGFATPTKLPADRQPAAGHRPRATESVELTVPGATASALTAYARRTGLTMNTVVQGAWAILLSRYSGERDVCFGSTTSVRAADLDDARPVVGLLINTPPARVAVDDHRDLGAWLRELQRNQVACREFAWLPLSRIQACGDLPAGVSLFDSIVVFQNYPFDRGPRPAGHRLVSFDVEFGLSFPLGLCVFPGEPTVMRLIYDAELFDRATVARMLEHLLVLLGSFADAGAIAGLTTLTEGERRTILADWAGTGTGRPPGRAIHEVIAERAARCPDTIAVELGDRRLSYAELDRAANRLAHHLIDLGAGGDVPVGLAFEPGPDLVAATLGVLKSGAACLPLDPHHPRRRLSAVLAEARPLVVLADDRFAARIAAAGGRTLTPDRAGGQPGTDPGRTSRPRDLAQVAYTSGPDGRPVGVLLEHGSLTTAVTGAAEAWRAEPERVFLQRPAGSGVTVEGFATLATGGTVVVAPAGQQVSAEWLRANAVTAADVPLGVLRTWEPEVLPELRTVRVGGEPLTAGLAEAWAAGRRLVNGYGVTEAGGVVTTCAVEPGTGHDRVPIGEPIPGARIHVLDARLSPVPAGVTGEVYVGGPGVARGYLRRPDRTADRFVADPFGPPGCRLYRTGDLARWRADGTLEFAGRTDRQVRVGGLRAEPGEVENLLARRDDVTGAAVLVREDDAGTKRLVAQVVPRPGTPAPSGRVLKAYLAEFLPAALVPSAFLLVKKLRPDGGEAGHRTLAVPGGAEPVSPRNPTEQALCRIWSEVLVVDRIGVEDDFFRLGGDSLTSIRLVARMREAFAVDLSPQDLFDRPRIAELAETIQDRVLEKLLSVPAAGD